MFSSPSSHILFIHCSISIGKEVRGRGTQRIEEGKRLQQQALAKIQEEQRKVG
jgi:hypothetical protein